MKSISYASSYYRTVIPCTTAFLGMGWYTLRRLMSPQLRWMFNGHQWWAIAFLPGNLTAFGFNRIFPERRHLHVEAPLSRKKIAIRMGWDGIPPNTIEYDWNFRCLRATPPSLYFDCCNCCIWYWSIVNATWLETVLYSRARWWCQKTVRRPKNWHFRQKSAHFWVLKRDFERPKPKTETTFSCQHPPKNGWLDLCSIRLPLLGE